MRNLVFITIAAVLTIVVALAAASFPHKEVSELPREVTEEQDIQSVVNREAGKKQSEKKDEWSPGLGITYTGKPGIELAPGIVMDFDGNIGPGF